MFPPGLPCSPNGSRKTYKLSPAFPLPTYFQLSCFQGQRRQELKIIFRSASLAASSDHVIMIKPMTWKQSCKTLADCLFMNRWLHCHPSSFLSFLPFSIFLSKKDRAPRPPCTMYRPEAGSQSRRGHSKADGSLVPCDLPKHHTSPDHPTSNYLV